MVSPVHFRDERLTSSFSYSPKKQVQATDDGGLQVCRDSEFVQVAMLEGKRAFQQFSIQGKPTVPDKTLGQLVGQALAQRLDRSTGTISQTDRITILAVAHYVKFFNFRTTSEFIKEYETKPLPATHYLRVSSTHWFDLAAIEDRKRVVKHILAMLAWAGKQQGGDGDGDGDESMEG
ncbi:hypothetical protein OCS_05994 [Ophiocordyceps sinensis CO18]|uniref:Uncharacterized protein n=1 Tax=Ophiocordyceps sinensis (strain Co18 / CGMCC 3.14243) TaxID=911162 RepID=T5A7A2_OPHSC|nr:hypothetical protein OCS_05994 [Ophiocordyceps sinensis CO18]